MVNKRSKVAVAFAALASAAVGCQLVASIEDVHYDPSDSQTSDTLAEVGDTSDSSVPADSSAVDSGDATTSDTADTKDSAVTDTGDTGLGETTVPPDTGPAPCPSKTGTTAMVRVTGPTKSFCIDVNEVTITQMELYDGLTLTAPPGLPTRCTGFWKRWYRRVAVGGDPPVTADEPAINVNWCQAFAYCKWAGKRLCRSLDSSGPSPTNSELFWACSNGGTSTRPYGPTYVAKSCDVESGRSTPTSITVAPKCHGTSPPYDKIFNLVGSAEEWSDECVDTGTKASCTTRGGYFGNASTDALCATTDLGPVDSEFASLGFRCCAD